jgi:hypothetical protein
MVVADVAGRPRSSERSSAPRATCTRDRAGTGSRDADRRRLFNEEIADRLYLSISTAKTHRHQGDGQGRRQGPGAIGRYRLRIRPGPPRLDGRTRAESQQPVVVLVVDPPEQLQSGYGRHHGIEGFREFSNPRGVIVRGTGDLTDAFLPPYGLAARAIVDGALGGAESAD